MEEKKNNEHEANNEKTNINEEYHGYIPEDEEDKKPSFIKRIFKAIAVCIILGVYAILFLRFFFSCDSKIVDDILKTDEIIAAHDASPDTFEIRQYEITDWYASKNPAGDDSNLGGKLLSVSDLYYIPSTESLQVTLKFNLDILENREAEYSEELLPFKLYLVEYEGEDKAVGEKFEDIAAVKYDERYSFGYIRICFDGIKLEKDGGLVDENGDPLMRSYGLFMHMYMPDGEYSDEDYDIFSVYTGRRNYKIIEYK